MMNILSDSEREDAPPAADLRDDEDCEVTGAFFPWRLSSDDTVPPPPKPEPVSEASSPAVSQPPPAKRRRGLPPTPYPEEDMHVEEDLLTGVIGSDEEPEEIPRTPIIPWTPGPATPQWSPLKARGTPQ